MCSIFGFIASQQPLDEPLLQGLSSLMKHRGEDSHGFYANQSVFLAHNRLAIQTLTAAGNQPMWTADKRYVLVYNGEIYNHISLRLKLKQPCTSNSDTETLLYLLVEYGAAILPELNGIFSFALLDTHTGKLLLARDVLGVKPLYYQQTANYFIFASELKSILQHPDFISVINQEALRNYLLFTYNPALTTLYENVLVFPAGCFAELDTLATQQTIYPQQYIALTPSPKPAFTEEKVFLNRLEEKLLHAVEQQLLAEVPIGLMLSGGLDSSAILALARTVKPDLHLPCYTIVQPDLQQEGFKNDLSYARLVAKQFGQTLEEVPGIVGLKDFALIAQYLEEPCVDVAPIYVYRMAALAKQNGIKVLLSGAGADELWGGYRRHLLAPHQQSIGLLPEVLARVAQDHLANPFFRRINKLMGAPGSTSIARQLGYFKWHTEKLIDPLFHTPTKANALHVFEEQYDRHLDLLSNMLNIELGTYLSRHNLLYHDKMGMANGVEIRVPLLDLDLLTFSQTVPSSLKVKGFTGKYLFRKVMEKYLPKAIIQRSKTGFGAPIRQLVKDDWRHDIQQLANTLPPTIFNKAAIQQLIRDNQCNKVDAGYALLGLWMMKAFMPSNEGN
jgi:asparagine synthase (glutamine-hydrolysing)